MKNKTAIFTSCAANYIPKARVLGSSVKHFHSDIDVYLLVVDELPTQFEAPTEQGEARSEGSGGSIPPQKEQDEPFDYIVEAKDLRIPDFERWLFKHRIVEACTAVKPFMLQHLLAKGYEQVMYFDPDIALFFPLTEMLAEFDDSSILLTPHLCKPEKTDEAVADNELSALKHGVFNFGYVGVQNDKTGRDYAQWWADRCYYACFEDIANGVFTDQKWNDLVPAFFDRVKILKSPVYNVATWNYAQRQIDGTPEEGFTVDGAPLVFHHFTGYDSGAHHAMLAKYGKAMPATQDLSEWYENACQHFAQAALSAVPWIYGCYDNGEAIAPHHRKIYRERGDLRDAFAHPFSTQAEGRYQTSYYHWLKANGQWEAPSFDATRAPRRFHEFLRETESDLRGYITRTHKLKGWQKKVVLAVLSAGFMVVRR